MSRDITVTLSCDQPGCPATTTYGVVPNEHQAHVTAAGWHVLVDRNSDEWDYCREHWVELGFDPKEEVEYE